MMARFSLLLVFGAWLLWAVPVWAEEAPHAAPPAHPSTVEEAAPMHGEATLGHEGSHEGVGEHASSEAHGVHEGKIKPHVTKTQVMNLLWWAVNFLILLVILYKYGRKPMADMFRSRREAIETEYRELEEKRREAEAKFQEYEKKLATLEDEAKKIVEAFIEQGQKEKERIIEEAKAAAERIKQQAEFYVQQELERAREELRKEVAELSVKLAEQVIQEKITPEDHKRLIQEFIERVVH